MEAGKYVRGLLGVGVMELMGMGVVGCDGSGIVRPVLNRYRTHGVHVGFTRV